MYIYTIVVIPYTMGTIILRESFHRYTLAVLCLDCPSLSPRQWHPSRSQCYPGYVDMRSPINRLAWCRVNLVQGLPGTSCLFIFRMALRKYPIFKSRSGEERQIWECLERRGGRVGHRGRLRDGSNEVAAASPAPPGSVPNVA